MMVAKLEKGCMMGKMTKSQKALNKAFDEVFRREGRGVHFDIFDLSKLRNDSLAAVQGGASMEEAVKAAIAKYRKN